jgi:hypothetical protein
MSIDKDMPNTTGCVLALVGMVLIFGNIGLEGFVIARLWRWFFVPLDLPALAWYQGSALTLLVSLLTYRRVEDRKKGEATGWNAFTRGVEAVTVSLLTLCVAYVLKVIAA